MTSFNEIAGNALLFFLVFGMSATVDIHMLLLQLKNIKAILMGVFLQFAILPMLGFLVVKFGGLERSAGISLLVVTSSPGGSYSNW
jgi:predicted Na+-dependent transporter